MDLFDGDVIIRQLRSLQVLETVHLMAGGTVTIYKHSQSIWEELDHFISKNCSLMHSVKTVHGVSSTIGIPHRMRYKSFNNRYKIFFGHKKPYQLETQQDQCKVRLEIVISREITVS